MSLRQGRPASRRAAAWPLAGLLTTVSLLALAGGAHAADADATDAAMATADTSPTAVGAVVVTAAPREEVAARAVQLAAPNEVRVQSAETILKYPDFNAAEALGRMPDISLSSDTGEGRFVQIRGIDANLDGATYGGMPLLNTNPGGTAAGGGGRAVEYDTIPTGAIDGIIVTSPACRTTRPKGWAARSNSRRAPPTQHQQAVPRSHPGRRLRAAARPRRPLRRRDRCRRAASASATMAWRGRTASDSRRAPASSPTRRRSRSC